MCKYTTSVMEPLKFVSTTEFNHKKFSRFGSKPDHLIPVTDRPCSISDKRYEVLIHSEFSGEYLLSCSRVIMELR